MDDEWTPKWAEEVAEAEGIALDERHWQVIAASRELIARSGTAPSLAQLSASCGVPVKEVRQLFPGVAEKMLARIAGAPELERRNGS